MMNTSTLNFGMFEALVDAGIKPELARSVERRVETAFEERLEDIRIRAREDLMTKADGGILRVEMQAIKSDLLKTINDQTWKLVSFVAVLNTLLVAAMKWLPG